MARRRRPGSRSNTKGDSRSETRIQRGCCEGSCERRWLADRFPQRSTFLGGWNSPPLLDVIYNRMAVRTSPQSWFWVQGGIEGNGGRDGIAETSRCWESNLPAPSRQPHFQVLPHLVLTKAKASPKSVPLSPAWPCCCGPPKPFAVGAVDKPKDSPGPMLAASRLIQWSGNSMRLSDPVLSRPPVRPLSHLPVELPAARVDDERNNKYRIMDYSHTSFFPGAPPYQFMGPQVPLTPSHSNSVASEDFKTSSPPVGCALLALIAESLRDREK